MKIRLYTIFVFGLLLNGLASISIASVPLPWLGMALMIGGSLFFWRRVVFIPSVIFGLLGLLLAMALMWNIAYWVEYSAMHPPGATTPYLVYVALRYITFLSFLASVLITLRLCQSGHVIKLINLLVTLGVVASVYAIYVYIAQSLGWPELLPRSRMGTGGGEQSVTFSYFFHRAMGSFREPSHLAEWLMLPFVLSFLALRKRAYWRSALIGSTIFLTGSMTGIMSLFIGFGLALVLLQMRPRRIRVSSSRLLSVLVAIIVTSGVFFGMNFLLNGLLFETIIDRTVVVLVGGMEESNRGYVYEYIETLPLLPLMGFGLGNVQIDNANAAGTILITSLLSLYFNVLYSVGIFGLFILVFILAYPLFLAFSAIGDKTSRTTLFSLVWGYSAWLVAFAVHSEELSIMFGVVYGLLIFNVSKPNLFRRSKELSIQ